MRIISPSQLWCANSWDQKKRFKQIYSNDEKFEVPFGGTVAMFSVGSTWRSLISKSIHVAFGKLKAGSSF